VQGDTLMTIVADLLQVADKIRAFLRVRTESDRAAFEKLVDPLYLSLQKVVEELLEMYEPAAQGILTLRQEYMDLHNQRIDSLWKATYGRGAATAAQQERYGLEVAKISAQTTLDITSSRGPAFHAVLEAFTSARAKTRPARIQVDAAALALLTHYDKRTDAFAKRMRDFATQIRVIVGRAHNEPLRSKEGSDATSARQSFSDFARDRLASITRLSERTFVDDVGEEVLTSDLEEHIDSRLATVERTLAEMDQLAESLESTCNMIRRRWDNLAYLYAMLRLSAHTELRQ